MAKCKECGEKYDVEDTASAIEEEFDGQIDMDCEFEVLCPECAILRLHNYGILGDAHMNGDWY